MNYHKRENCSNFINEKQKISVFWSSIVAGNYLTYLVQRQNKVKFLFVSKVT